MSRQTLSLGATAAGGLEDGGQLVETAADGVTRARGVLEDERAETLRLGGHCGRERVNDLGQGGVETPAPVTADVEHETGGAHARGDGEVVEKAGAGALSDVVIGRGQVDEVGGVAKGCRDLRVGFLRGAIARPAPRRCTASASMPAGSA